MNVPISMKWREYLAKGLQSDEKVDLVCYCSVGYRSSIVAEQILKLKEDGQLPQGLRPVNLEGSIFQWASEGRSLTSASLFNSLGSPDFAFFPVAVGMTTCSLLHLSKEKGLR